MEIKIVKTSSVKSIKKQFQKQFNCNLRLYKGSHLASDEMKISDISKETNFKGSLELGARSRVKNVEDYFMQEFGVKAQISNADDSKLAKDDMTLTQAGKL